MLPQGYEYQDKSLRRSFSEGRAGAVLRVLARRNVAVSDEQRERISACTDLETLDRWLDRAVTAASADELFKD